MNRTTKALIRLQQKKADLDENLQHLLARYDSAYIENVRASDRVIATLTERIHSLEKLQQMPKAIQALENEAARMQADIDRLRNTANTERQKLQTADQHIIAIADEFKRIMIAVSFPGVSEDDKVIIDPRNWKPVIRHGDQEWSFWDTGSGGKKTLFNVCYALALHSTAIQRKLPVPSLLIIDSPTKNISEDENPELVRLLYREIYHLAEIWKETHIQFLLIDSDLMMPDHPFATGFRERRMAGDEMAPRLISYYTGP
jgi:DNA repair exonuclease SbcCD ATPase subunit